MNNSRLKIFIKFLPLLLLYVFVVIIMPSSTSLLGDEARYAWFATNLSNGYYTTLQNALTLWNGPGYPIVLLPFVMLKLPWMAARLLNAVFQFAAVLYMYYTLSLYMRKRSAFIFSYIFGLYPPFMRYMYMVFTESLSIFLICGFIFHFCKLHKYDEKHWFNLLIASFYLGYLTLTKISFGYAILTALLFVLALYVVKKTNELKKTIFIYLLAMLLCLPYLFYTYSLTGKIFYWGNSGGNVLYALSSPYEEDLGDTLGTPEMFAHPVFLKNHGEFYEKLDKLSPIETDEALRKKAIHNIINNPGKFFKNWLANNGRIWFNYPYSIHNFFPEKQFRNLILFMVPNVFLFVISILCIYPTYRRRKLIPYEIYAVGLFGLISFGGSTLLSAIGRYILPVVPFLFLWISFILTRIVKIELQD